MPMDSIFRGLEGIKCSTHIDVWVEHNLYHMGDDIKKSIKRSYKLKCIMYTYRSNKIYIITVCVESMVKTK